MRSKQLTGSIVALTAALLFATTALANGEPKNQLPFTATVAHDQIAPDWFERYAAAHPYGRNLNQPAPSLVVGEAKNQSPFNSRAATATASLDVFERYAAAHPYGRGITTLVAPETTGEAKSEPPFNRTISAPRAFPDWFERYAAAHPYGRGLNTVAANPGARAVSEPLQVAAAPFHWRDALIGGAVATLILVSAAAVGATRLRSRKPVGV